ncbi:uncharacterized protein METZ01_LOCUS193431, partial [marine metagenome]
VFGIFAAVYADDVRIAIFNVDGVYQAISDTCIHAGASLGDGGLPASWMAI